MPEQYIIVEREAPIAVVTLNRPDKLNALNWTIVTELADQLEALDRDNAIRCIVLTGAGGRAFAAGADIGEMSGKSAVDMVTGGFDSWDRIRRIKTPLIAAVAGYALGGGNELAMHCDMIIASEKARFGQPEILIGVMPGAGGTQRLARTIGKYRAMEICLTGRQATAHEMHDWGLVNRVVPDGQHVDEAKKLAHEVAKQAPIAARFVKEAVLKAFEMPLEDGLVYEKRLFALLFSTEDQKEGMRAFLAKESPTFRGS
jgi:enoyl-CoA hydratase